MKALVIGATGATGKDLVNILLQDPYYKEVVTFVRRPTGLVNPKLAEVITDFDKLEAVSDKINGDVWFSCLGTTAKIAGTKENYWHIDYEIPLKFAGIAKRNSIPDMVLLSAYSASSSSRVFYSKMKGQLEEAMIKLNFNRCVIFRPGLLMRKDSARLGEKVSEKVINFLNTIGLIRNFKPMPTFTLAEKLAKAPKVSKEGVSVVKLEEVFSF